MTGFAQPQNFQWFGIIRVMRLCILCSAFMARCRRQYAALNRVVGKPADRHFALLLRSRKVRLLVDSVSQSSTGTTISLPNYAWSFSTVGAKSGSTVDRIRVSFGVKGPLNRVVTLATIGVVGQSLYLLAARTRLADVYAAMGAVIFPLIREVARVAISTPFIPWTFLASRAEVIHWV